MERIIIIGCSGSGKSTLGRQLREKLGLPLIHLDQLWWRKGWEHVTREAFDEQLDLALNMESWIIDGDFSRTIQKRIARCDTVIYLDFNRWECLWGVFQRVFGNYGKVRPDMAEGCPERLNWNFIKYVWNFRKNNHVLYETYLAQAKHAEKIVLKNRREVKAFLEKL